MKLTVCIGSSCHIKGSGQVVEQLQQLLEEHKLTDKVEMTGTFCIGRCQTGVSVLLDGEYFSLSPETTKDFFEKEILAKVS